MGLEPLGEQLGKDQARLRRGEDGVEGHVGSGTVVGVIHVHAAVVAHGGIPAHHRVGPVAADDARQLPAERERRLEHPVLVAEEDHLGDPEDATGLPLLLLADGHQRLPRHVDRGVVVRARACRW